MSAQQLEGEHTDHDCHEETEDAERGVNGLFHGPSVSISLIGEGDRGGSTMM